MHMADMVNSAKRLQKARVEVHVNSQTTHNNGEETLFWRVPFETTFTRQDYRDDEDDLFTLLNKRLPFAEWSRLECRTLDTWDWKPSEIVYDYRNNTTEQQVKEELALLLGVDVLGYTCADLVSTSTWRFTLSQKRHGSAMPTTVGDMRSLSVGTSK
jgi:hypothetical protein